MHGNPDLKSLRKPISFVIYSFQFLLKTVLGVTFCLAIIYYSLNSGFFEVTTRFDQKLGWTNKSNISGINKGLITTTNSLGFRSEKVNLDKPINMQK